jgi:3-hydroxyacyl-CoA dehydrogenase
MKSAADVLRGGAVAIVGTGLVGMGWAVVFARAGATVHLYDANPQVLEAAPARILRQLEDLDSYGLLSEPATVVMSRIKSCASLSLSLEGATYVQESILERVDHKRALMEQLQSCDDGRRIIGSSTSGIPASQFANDLAITPRVIIVHPVNPPSLVPLVELVPSPGTSSRTLEFASELMGAVGQTAITVNREIEGFVLNRLQAVLLREAWALVEDGIVSAEDVDKTVRDGLGWRWSFMGPFETIDLNAVGGVADYAARLGPLYQRVAASRAHDAPWDTEIIARVDEQMRAKLPLQGLVQRCQWRDRQLMAFARYRRAERE